MRSIYRFINEIFYEIENKAREREREKVFKDVAEKLLQ